jgi:hypothetical protein
MRINRLNWNWFKRMLIVLFLLIMIQSILTGKNIIYCQGKPTSTPTPQVTSQVTPSVNAQDAILQAAQMAIGTSQTAISSIQTTVCIIALIVALFGICNFATIMIYIRRIESIKGLKIELQELKGEIQTQNSNVQKLKEELEEKKSILLEQESFLRHIAKDLAVYSAITQLQNINPKIRSKNLFNLSQYIHPDGVIPMINFLTNEKELLEDRIMVAKGLGRYSENSDLDDKWDQIFDSFKNVLENDDSPHELIGEIMKSTAKFQSDARDLFPLIIKWSRDEDIQLQQTFIESFGKAEIYDDIIINRLKEMGFSEGD